jgi:3',5'-nucleoside bisphosphate phosphatase
MQIDILGISDHNSTRHGPLMRRLGEESGIFVLTGAEVTSREEVHCLTFFENDIQLEIFQQYLDQPYPFSQ